jgi:hypothetical protein
VARSPLGFVDVLPHGDWSRVPGHFPHYTAMIPNEGKAEIITGELGSGKTACGVEMAYELLCMGGWVFTQVRIHVEEVRKRMASEGLEFDPERLVLLSGSLANFHRQIKRGADGEVVMALIDEAHLEFNAKDYRDTSRELLDFITLARKLDIWVVFISQDANNVDKQVRRMFAVETACRSLKEERLFDAIPFPIPAYARVRFKVYQGKAHHKISSEWHWFRLPSWGLFDSKALLGAKADEFSKMVVARRTKLKRVARPASDYAPAIAGFLAALLCVL